MGEEEEEGEGYNGGDKRDEDNYPCQIHLQFRTKRLKKNKRNIIIQMQVYSGVQRSSS